MNKSIRQSFVKIRFNFDRKCIVCKFAIKTIQTQSLILFTRQYILQKDNNSFNHKQMGCVQSSGNSQANKLRKMQIEKMRKQIQRKNKEISLLQKQNVDLKCKKREQLEEVSKQIRENDIQIIQFEEDGQAEGNNNDDTDIGSLLKCTICQQQYNLTDRIPSMVCANQHTYCSECISGMLRRNRNTCPQCRQPITAGNKNFHLFQLIQNLTNNSQNHQSKLNNSPAKQLNITVCTTNKYYNKFNYYPPNTIIKGLQYAWYGLLFNEVLPVEGKFKFCIEVVFSLHNNIEIGLIDISSKVEKGKMSNKRISLHLIDGKVMDSGNIDKPNTVWRQIGQPAPQGTSKVIVEVNMDENKIKWIVNDKVHAETVITNYLKYAKAVPYLAMYHTEDVVALNAW